MTVIGLKQYCYFEILTAPGGAVRLNSGTASAGGKEGRKDSDLMRTRMALPTVSILKTQGAACENEVFDFTA